MTTPDPRTTQVETDRSRNAFASAKAATDPMLEALAAAPLDDEPTTDEEDRSAREAIAAYERGEAISADEIKRELGSSSSCPWRFMFRNVKPAAARTPVCANERPPLDHAKWRRPLIHAPLW